MMKVKSLEEDVDLRFSTVHHLRFKHPQSIHLFTTLSDHIQNALLSIWLNDIALLRCHGGSRTTDVGSAFSLAGTRSSETRSFLLACVSSILRKS